MIKTPYLAFFLFTNIIVLHIIVSITKREVI